MLCKHLLDTVHKVALKLILILESLLLDALLAVRALLPASARALVATEVDILRWEEREYLIENTLDKLEG